MAIRTLVTFVSVVSVASLLVACGAEGIDDRAAQPASKPAIGSSSDASAPASAAPASASGIDRSAAAGFGPGMDGARALLGAFLDPKTDRMALTLALRPEPEDFDVVFTEDAVPGLRKGYEEFWRIPVENPEKAGGGIGPKEGQTELLLVSATGADFNTRTPAAEEFPGGYGELQGKFRDDAVLYRWKFVEPGEELGMAFDGLAHVNGRWVWFPKPWRAMKSPA